MQIVSRQILFFQKGVLSAYPAEIADALKEIIKLRGVCLSICSFQNAIVSFDLVPLLFNKQGNIN